MIIIIMLKDDKEAGRSKVEEYPDNLGILKCSFQHFHKGRFVRW